MDIINTILKLIISLLNVLLPAIGLSDDFLSKIDAAITIIINLINGAGYFIPLDILGLCLLTLLLFDNSVLIFRVGQWIIKLIRG